MRGTTGRPWLKKLELLQKDPARPVRDGKKSVHFRIGSDLLNDGR